MPPWAPARGGKTRQMPQWLKKKIERTGNVPNINTRIYSSIMNTIGM
jgi:hypothetical protein